MPRIGRPGTRSRRRLVCGAFFLAVALAAAPAAYAQETVYSFDIRQQDLRLSLQDFARVSGLQFAYDSNALNGKIGAAVHGQFSDADALKRLLASTGLAATRLPGGVVKISVQTKSSTPEPTPGEPAVTVPAKPVEVTPETTVVVRGVKASLQDAMTSKEYSRYLRDAIVAEDIGKLPDNNISEAMQRVSGVQITRNHGEGSGIAIRGLTQVKTLLNGREIYSDTGRDLSLEFVPAEIFSRIDLYKNPPATFIEGGVGGVIDLQTRRPFDFRGSEFSASLRQNYYDLAQKAEPEVSGLISNRWITANGEVGLLVAVADLKSAGRFDQVGVEPFSNRYDVADFNHNGQLPGDGSDPGDLVAAPGGGGNSIELTDRRRTALNVVAQWRPNDLTELTAELTHSNYKYLQSAYLEYANRGPLLPAPGANFAFDGDTNVLEVGSYRDVTFTSNSNYFDRTAFTDQIALSGKWLPAPKLKLTADVAFTNSDRTDWTGGVRIGNSMNPTGTTLSFDLRGDIPELSLTGFDKSDPSAYNFIDSSHAVEKAQGSGVAARFDGVWQVASGVIQSMEFGGRLASRNILRRQGIRQHMPQGVTLPISVLPAAAAPIPYSDFFRGAAPTELIDSGLLGTPISLVRNISAVCAALGDAVCYPSFDPLNTYSADESTSATYGQIDFDFKPLGWAVTGNLGERYVSTDLKIDGFRTSNYAQSAPVHRQSAYGNFLPSFNLDAELARNIHVKFAAGEEITRPSFSLLAPNLSLSISNANTTLIGTAGNPDLRPLRATSYDLSFEDYFSKSGFAYLSLFHKNVSGFIQTVTTVEAVSFPDYAAYSTAQITRPQNGNHGVIDGYEVGVQTFLEFLPAPFDGLGLQANYTRVNSTAPGPIAGTTVPLVGLSKNSYNLVTYYEKGRYRARIAYTYRDSYVDTTSGPGSGFLPIYAAPTSYLAASIGYRLNAHTDVSIDSDNTNAARYSSYFGTPDRPRFRNTFDRRIGIVLRMTY